MSGSRPGGPPAADLVEAGLHWMDGGLRAMRGLWRVATGRLAEPEQPQARVRSPIPSPGQAPSDADRALADLANRLVRSWRRAGSPEDLPELVREAAAAAAAAFSYVDPRRPRDWLALAGDLPLAGAGLAVQEALRGLLAARSVPPDRLADFLAFTVETFSDLQIYFSLRYREEVERLRERVRRRPDDLRARLDLGRTLLKCGLFREAAAELDGAARLGEDAGDPALRRRALYEAAVAHHRRGAFSLAVDRAAAATALDPGDGRARFRLWLAAREAGGYPEHVPQDHRMEAVDGRTPCPVELEECSAELGLDKVSGGRGTAVADFFGDGRLHVVVAGAHAGCSLYRNRGDGTFEDVTREAGLGGWGPGFTAAWTDYDGDGRLDLFVAHNLGGLFDPKTPNRLFRNRGDGTFEDVSRGAGLATPWPTLGAAWGDATNDGRPDLFLSNVGRGQLFLNEGDGTFTDVSREAGIDRPAVGSVAFWCDIDDDGWLDIVQLTYSRPQDAIFTLRHGHGPPGGAPLRIFRNNRDGTFTDVAREMGVTGCWGTMSANAGDFDNDGRLDLLLGNGDPGMDRTEASVLLRNAGGRFENVTFTAGLPATGKGHGVNLADLAGDGRLHLIVASGGLYPGDLQPTEVYRPRTRPGSYLNVRLVGTRSNRDALGARLALAAGGRTRHRLVSGGSSFGCLPTEQHFGLGELTEAEELRVRWPSGIEERIPRPPVNATVRVVEGEGGSYEVLGPPEAGR